jgi:catechol 2,3-dioxygenase-like lactoylglutathione lyase family enzyme
MPFPRIQGVVETCIYSGDLPRSISFYRDRLGLHLLESLDRLCAFAAGDHQVLLIFLLGGSVEPVQMPGGLIPPHDGSGQSHFAFAISKEDFLAWKNHLIAQGIDIESEVDWPAGGKSLYFRDPDHNLVEFATPGIWAVY